MATSFDNFLASDPNYVQYPVVQPTPDNPTTMYSPNTEDPSGTPLAPVDPSSLSGGVNNILQQTAQAAPPQTGPDANAAAGAGDNSQTAVSPPTAQQSAAASPPPVSAPSGDVHPDSPMGQAIQNAMARVQGTQAQPQTAPSRKISFLDAFGGIANALATAGGRPAQYQTTQQRNDAKAMAALNLQTAQQNVQGGALDNESKVLDHQQTSGAIQQQNVQRLGQYINAVKASGNDPQLVAKAQSLFGITPEQAAALSGLSPQALDALAAADPAKAGARQLALTYTPGYDAQGNPVYSQAGADGQFHPVAGFTPMPKTQVIDNGQNNQIVNTQNGKVIQTFQKSGAPEAGTTPTQHTDTQGNVTFSYTPNSPHAADEHAKAASDAQAAAMKQQQAQQQQWQQYQGSVAHLTDLKNSILDLAKNPNLNASTGRPGQLARLTRSTNAADFDAAVSKVTGNALPAVLSDMKAAGGSQRFAAQEILGALGKYGDFKNTSQDSSTYRAMALMAAQKLDQQIKNYQSSYDGWRPPARVSGLSAAAQAYIK